MNSLAENLMLSNGVLALFLAMLSVHPARRQVLGAGTLWLAALLGTFGFIFLDWWLYLSGLIESVPFIVGYSWLLPLFLGPLFYGFSRWLLGEASYRRMDNLYYWLLHGLPIVIFFIVTIPFLLLPGEDRLVLVRSATTGDPGSWITSFRLLCYAASIFFYSSLSAWLTRTTQENPVLRENIWVVRWSAILLALYSTIIVVSALIWHSALSVVIACLIFLMLASISAFSRLQPAIRRVQEAKYQNSEVPDSVVRSVTDQITEVMTHERWFLEENTSLAYLAERLGFTPHQMSQIINRGFNRSYAELLNDFRIQHATDLLQSQQDKAIVDIAIDCGFGSKSSFYNAFRKKMNCTPSEYRKKTSFKST